MGLHHGRSHHKPGLQVGAWQSRLQKLWVLCSSSSHGLAVGVSTQRGHCLGFKKFSEAPRSVVGRDRSQPLCDGHAPAQTMEGDVYLAP